MELKRGEYVQVCYNQISNYICYIVEDYIEEARVLQCITSEGILTSLPLSKTCTIIPISEATYREACDKYLEEKIVSFTNYINYLNKCKECLKASVEITDAWNVGEDYEGPKKNRRVYNEVKRTLAQIS